MIWLSLALAVLPAECGLEVVEAEFLSVRQVNACAGLTFQLLLVLLYLCLSVPFLIYACLIVSHFRVRLSLAPSLPAPIPLAALGRW